MGAPIYNSALCIFWEEVVGGAVSTGELAIHGSKALQHGVPCLGQTGRNKEETGPVYYSRNSGPLHVGALVPEVLVLIQTHHLMCLSTMAQQIIALQLLTKCVLCSIGEQDLHVGLSWHILLCNCGRLEVFVQLGWDVLSQHVVFTQLLTVRWWHLGRKEFFLGCLQLLMRLRWTLFSEYAEQLFVYTFDEILKWQPQIS